MRVQDASAETSQNGEEVGSIKLSIKGSRNLRLIIHKIPYLAARGVKLKTLIISLSVIKLL